MTTHRPKIGLVLSGGGAKGLAHIGVLKVLEEAGIRPDYIGGASMGGIVGALYAMGYSADSLEAIAKSIRWPYYLSDDIPRTDITIEEKDDHDRFVFSVPIAEKGIKIPGGVINGQNIENLLSKLCAPVYEIRDFDKFQIPFLCNATDMVTGKEVVFRSGYLPDALRATMAIPSIFEPIDMEGALLVDGGLVNNFPAERVKEMGADIIIGVDVGFQYYPKDQLNTMFRIIEQSLFFYGETNTSRNKKLCNIIISPPLGKFNAGSFNACDSLIALGEATARRIFPQLKALADSLKALDQSFGPDQHIDLIDSLFLSEIVVYGLERVSGDLLAGKLQLPLLKMVTPVEIGDAIDRLYASFYFEKVSYEIEKNNAGIRLIVRVKENSDGSLRFGLHYDSNTKSAIIVNTTFRNLLFAGSKLALNAGLGENPFFKTEYFKNNGWKPGLGVAFQSSRTLAYMFRDTRKISSWNLYETKLQLYTQSIFQNSYALGGGIEFENSLIRPVIDPGETMKESRYQLINYYAFLHMDSYDNLFYPTRGIKFYSEMKLVTSRDFLPVAFVHARMSKAKRITERLTLIGHINAGAVDGDSIPTQYHFFAGGKIQEYRDGLMPFVGYEYMELYTKNLLSLKLDLQMRLFGKIYLIGELNAGNFKDSFNDLFTINDVLGGYGLTLGYNSLIGPLEISLSRSANHSGLNSFLRIGFWF